MKQEEKGPNLSNPLGGAEIGNFQNCQHHLMLRKVHMRPYVVTKIRCVWNKTFLLAEIGNFQNCQHHLMLRKVHMRLYVVTKIRCVWNKTFLLVLTICIKFILCSFSPLFIIFLFIH